MTIALVAHVSAPNSTSTDPTTSSAIDTTGSSLIVGGFSSYAGGDVPAPTPSDSKSNSWTGLAQQQYAGSGSTPRGGGFYVQAPIVGTGHTFTLTKNVSALLNGSPFPVAAFSGLAVSNVLDVNTINGGSGVSTLQAGSVTPSVANSLIVALLTFSAGASVSIDSGFLIAEQYGPIDGYGCALAYLFQGAAAAVNPTWTMTSGNGVASLAVFKPASASPIPTQLTLTTQPSGANSNIAFTVQPVVAVQDVSGVTVTGDTSNVTATLTTINGSGVLSGTTTKAAVAGVATFTDLKIYGSGSFLITFSDGSLTPVDSSTFICGVIATIAITCS